MKNPRTSQRGIFDSISHGFMSLLVYGMLFIALMIAFNGPITFDTLIMPAAFIYVVVRAIEYVTIKKTNNVPRWLVLGSFGIAVLTAIGMTYWII